MQTTTTDQFQVEHIEYISNQPFDDVVAALEKATGDVTDGKYASEVASAKDKEDYADAGERNHRQRKIIPLAVSQARQKKIAVNQLPNQYRRSPGDGDKALFPTLWAHAPRLPVPVRSLGANHPWSRHPGPGGHPESGRPSDRQAWAPSILVP
jgi:hypothetical protein